jgi:uncharacterized protein (TIGR02646 family)
MIHVDRSQVPEPAILSSPRAKEALEQAFVTAGKGEEVEAQPRIYGSAEVRDALALLFLGKCAFCDGPVDVVASPIIDHFRPKRGAMALDGTRHELHYFWLAYDWNNILAVCPQCNRMKATRFPIAGERAEMGAMGTDLDAEQPLLLDPCADNPEEHLVYLDNGEVVSLTERGRVSTEVLGLNRTELTEKRASALREVDILLRSLEGAEGRERDELASLLEEQVRPEIPYAAIRRQAVLRWLEGHRKLAAAMPALDWTAELRSKAPRPASKQQVREARKSFETYQVRQQSYSVEGSSRGHAEAYFSGAKRIERIEIRNFKAIEELDLVFPPPPPEREAWMMLLGENATGKSSVLQAVALALMGERHANRLGLDAARFVRFEAGKAEKGSVRVHVTNVGPIELSFSRQSSHFRVNPPEPKVLLHGYGATRLLPRAARRKSSDAKHIRIKNLFDPTHPLQDAEAWLSDPRKVSDERFRDIAAALVKLLMLPESTRMFRSDGRVEVEVHGYRSDLKDLSDGYQSIVALVVDIAIGTARWPKLAEAEGLVLLDEIEVHLHPLWKLSIVERLRTACPHLGFLVTTHDPLCLKGLGAGEIVVLRRDDNHRIYSEADIPPIDHLRADQLLTSFLFNLPSTRSSAMGPMVARYSMLLGREARTPAEQKEFDELQAKLTRQLSSAMTPDQVQVEAAVTATLLRAGDVPVEQGELRPDVALEVRRQLAEILGPKET